MVGRPPLYDSPESLQIAIDAYFSTCVADEQFPTITGLALALGFATRQSFYDYEEHEQYSYIIKKARLRVEHGYEQRLGTSSPTGAIFALKNMGWRDKTETDTTLKGEVTINKVVREVVNAED